MNSFEGIWVPLVTPFKHGKIDVNAVQELANYLVYSGVQGLVIGGTTGEGCALDKNEQQLLLAAVHEAVGNYCPLLFGLSGINTREFVDKVKRLKPDLLSGFLVSTPAYIRPSQEGLRLHFSAIAAATELPLVLYNVPARTGVNMNVDTVIELAQSRQFAAIKECSEQTRDLVARTRMPVLCGNDETLLNDLCLGASGAISAAAHIRPDLFVHLYKLVSAGHINQAHRLFEQLLPMITLLFSEPNPAPVKAALAVQGFITDSLRSPMTCMSALGKAALFKEVERVMNIVAGYNQPAFLNR
ncbi:4-hydroxy-tetrahydrodipicolinate synthase [Cellvibrio mixtus]|uniref:4-hydroxy-tetrahydrodipicolinate synthase n=1 Tax=Cellvibrio mixtus TaxID=39650 RepID=UPI000586D1B1|nr:4-hydroxy-tetrahydrodipicolinate synthase [Cellvibrio mixtus]